jgi:hypothetical protein
VRPWILCAVQIPGKGRGLSSLTTKSVWSTLNEPCRSESSSMAGFGLSCSCFVIGDDDQGDQIAKVNHTARLECFLAFVFV